MVSGGAQVKVYASESSLRAGTAQVASWNTPAYIVITSYSVGQGQGQGQDSSVLTHPYPAVIHKRIADALGIVTGDMVSFDLCGHLERLSLPVTVKDDNPHLLQRADFVVNLLHGLAPLLVGVRYGPCGEHLVTFTNGDQVHLFPQELWAGTCGMDGILTPFGTAILTFDGACRNYPEGFAGCGFCIFASLDGGMTRAPGGDLVVGSRYCGLKTSNEIKYWGLIEGLYWALRLKLMALVIEGDSELVIKQVKGDYEVKAKKLQPLHRMIREMLQQSSIGCVMFRQIYKQENTISDALANRAIDEKENIISCNWENINQQCRRISW